MTLVERRHEDLNPVYLYMENFGNWPLLEAHEEVELAQSIELGRSAWNLAIVEERPLTTKEGEAFMEGLASRERFINSNLRLVFSIAKRFRAYHNFEPSPFLDVIQAGNLGLEHAVEKFDWSMGFKFSTYASNWIKQSISRHIGKDYRMVIPGHVQGDVSLLDMCEKLYGSDEIVLKETGWDKEKLASVRQARRLMDEPVESLDRKFGYDGSGEEAYDVTPDNNASVDFAAAEQARVLEQIIEFARSQLDDKEFSAYMSVSGLSNEDPKPTRQEVSDRTGISVQQIRDIVNRMKSFMSHPSVGIQAEFSETLSWQQSADCKEIGGVAIFFTKRGQSTKVAKAICAQCTQRETCLEFGMSVKHGIWGGESERGRRRLRPANSKPVTNKAEQAA
jgi:RNA polymerase primary sigma factor